MDILHLVSKYAICYGVFFLVSYISKTESSNRLLNANGMVKNPGMLLGLQIAGILWFGVVPFFIFPYSFNDIVFGREMPSIFQLSCLVLIIIISIVIAIRESVKQHPGKIKNQQEAIFFNKKFIRRYFFLRAIFLICYEIFFRGYLLFDITPRTGIFFSVALNIGLYCLLHIFNDKKEIIACIPFGFILCSVCLWFNAAWPAIVTHVVFALVYELRLVNKIFHPVNNTVYENFCYRLLGVHRK